MKQNLKKINYGLKGSINKLLANMVKSTSQRFGLIAAPASYGKARCQTKEAEGVI